MIPNRNVMRLFMSVCASAVGPAEVKRLSSHSFVLVESPAENLPISRLPSQSDSINLEILQFGGTFGAQCRAARGPGPCIGAFMVPIGGKSGENIDI